ALLQLAQDHHDQAGASTLDALTRFARLNDPHSVEKALQQFAEIARAAPAHVRTALLARAREAGISDEDLRMIEEAASQPPPPTEN
ncbi:MAG: hypothetical protein J0I06_18180, partial [Planctomycetes bacterium]|nr:hypothetical protein [Planctomycetota bacterium]